MAHIYNPSAHDPPENNSGKCANLAPLLVAQWLSMIGTMDIAAGGGFLGKPGTLLLVCASFCFLAAAALRCCAGHPNIVHWWLGECSILLKRDLAEHSSPAQRALVERLTQIPMVESELHLNRARSLPKNGTRMPVLVMIDRGGFAMLCSYRH